MKLINSLNYYHLTCTCLLYVAIGNSSCTPRIRYGTINVHVHPNKVCTGTSYYGINVHVHPNKVCTSYYGINVNVHLNKVCRCTSYYGIKVHVHPNMICTS